MSSDIFFLECIYVITLQNQNFILFCFVLVTLDCIKATNPSN